MAEFIKDDIDFRAYERMTEARVKVRAASAWSEDLVQEFALRDDQTSPHPTITSLRKLEHRINFRPGEITVWAGYSGHRKSMFTGQVALDLVAQDRRVLIASMEMQPARTLARMARQASGNRYPTPGWIDRFGAWSDSRLWVFDHMGRVDPSLMLGVCRYFAEEKKGQHVFIDSMMMVCASEESLDEQKQFATDLVRMAQETDLHLHLIAHCRKPQDDTKPPTKYDVRGSSAITDQAPNVITVWANKPKFDALAKAKPTDYTEDLRSKPDAVVSIEKQRNGSYEGKVGLWFCDSSLRFTSDRTEPVIPYDIQH